MLDFYVSIQVLCKYYCGQRMVCDTTVFCLQILVYSMSQNLSNSIITFAILLAVTVSDTHFPSTKLVEIYNSHGKKLNNLVKPSIKLTPNHKINLQQYYFPKKINFFVDI